MAKKREKKAAPPPPGAPLWMATFADIALLLLCFLVLILSFSTMDEPSFVKIAGSLKDAFGVQTKDKNVQIPQAETVVTLFETVPFEVREPVQEAVQELVEAGLVTVEEDEREILLRIQNSVAFASGRAAIKDDFKKLLDELGEIIAETQSSLVVEGHTDNVPLRAGAPFASNWELSSSRAVAVVEYLATEHHIPRDRLAAVAHADGKPVAPNDTAEGRAANRRVEFRIRPGEDLQVVEDLGETIELDIEAEGMP
ncbi:MAG: OmpA family protein [Desulfurivibrio sp.]|nr:OmpA family protein [Desulfurivibrio sp.]